MYCTCNKHKISGKSAYAVGSQPELIQKEIMTNGPVEAAFTVFGDFVTYKKGFSIHFKKARSRTKRHDFYL